MYYEIYLSQNLKCECKNCHSVQNPHLSGAIMSVKQFPADEKLT